MTISCKTALDCYPISRPRIYEDVLDNKYGEIDRIWMTPGHIFVTVKEGIQLFTFDNKSASRSTDNSFDSYLDVKDFKSPVLNILVSATNYNVVYIILVNSSIHCWRYKSDRWSFVIEFSVCPDGSTTVIDACLHPSQNILYWCEKHDTIPYCNVRKCQLPEDEEKLKTKEYSLPVELLSNCPPCHLYSSASGIYVVIRSQPPMIPMVVLLSSFSNKIVVCIGKNKKEIKDLSSQQSIDFTRLASKLVGSITQVKPTDHHDGVIYSVQDMCLSVISDDGYITSLSETEGDVKKKQYLLFSSEEIQSDEWFEYQNVIGCLKDSKICLYRKDEMESRLHVILVDTPDGNPVLGLCKLSIGTTWPAFYTQNNIYSLQWLNKDDKQKVEVILKSSNFQTPAVQLAFLEQQKSDDPSPKVYKDLDKLRQEHLLSMDNDPTTKLASLLEPYLKNYWDLDSLQQNYLTNVSNLPSMTIRQIEDEVKHTLSPQTPMAMATRQSWLLLLSCTFPKQVLQVFTSLMDFETDDISASQIQRWQCILANENTSTAVSSDVAVPLFEHICRLMLLIQPNKLVQFVKLCQMINNQKVGVSAFIRKRQALQYYDRALDCLPPCQCSENPDVAVTAYVEIIMASEKSQCESTALRMYIDHGKWDDAIELIKQYKTHQNIYQSLYLTLFRAMSQKEVLSQYAEKMFSESPETSCFSQISAFLVPKEGTSAQDVFMTSSTDIPMYAVKKSLVKYCNRKS